MPEPPAHADLVIWFERVLVPQNAPALHRYVRRLLPGDPHRSEDVVQETLLRAWRHLTAVAAAASPQAWLTRVARNVVIDGLRRAATHPVEVDEDVTAAVAEAGEVVFDAALERAVLGRALWQLSPVHREVLVLVHLQDRTHADVADRLGVPPGTVKSRVHYAARELRRALGDLGVTGVRF